MFQIFASFIAGMYVAQEYDTQVPRIKPLLVKALKDIRDTLADSVQHSEPKTEQTENINKKQK